MRIHQVDKHYLYHRDGGRCYFCAKILKYDKVTIDHYLPKSLGGTDEIFNLVISCKSCNSIKKNTIPEDVESKHLEWFTQGVIAGKILAESQLKISHQALNLMAISVIKCYISGEYTIFETPENRLYVRDNKVCKIKGIHQVVDGE